MFWNLFLDRFYFINNKAFLSEPSESATIDRDQEEDMKKITWVKLDCVY